MPDNAFARNNASKLLALPRYLAGDLLSRLVPRRRGSWVVGSALGVNDGARALVVEALSRPAAPRVAWLARSADEAREARAIGAEVLRHGSWRAFWRALRADVVVVTHGFGDASRFGSRGALVVNLWHGSPIKRMHLDSPAALRLPVLGGTGPARKLMAAMYRRGTSRIGVMPAGSELVVPRLRGAFGLPEGRVEVLGEPRTDVLFRGGAQQRRRAARTRLESSVGPVGTRRIVLFAPTWRDGRADPVVPSGTEWQAIESWLAEHDAVLVVRPHPLGIGDYTHTSDAVRLLTSEVEPEVMAVLDAADALITDFSSVLIDFAVTGGPIVHLAPDEVTYAAEHGLYEPYPETAGGQVQRTWAEALERLSAVVEDGPARSEALAHSARVAQRFHAHHDGRSAARVVDRVLALTGGEPREVWPATVFFESFHGRNVSCNPAAIDRELSSRMPSARRSWSVTDASVTVPEGAAAVRRGTPEWFAARDAADLLVLNDWVEDDWRPRRDQFLLQTWHGTPLKRIALGRRGRSPRLFAAVVKQSSRWSAMLAQSVSAARLLRLSYAVARPMWVEGYPRNDVIARGDDSGIRSRLGIGTPKVVLYAPTWRDDALDAPDLLDVADLADRLGPDWTVLVRGHARTMGVRAHSHGERVQDVTTVPDVSPLLATADVLITDYSSVMFDFSASGRPMVFFVADAEEYATSTRGFNWDLGARAPGPLVRTTQECADAVLSATADRERWATKYAAWQDEFNALDDGEASRRVVDRLLSAGARRARRRG